MAATDAPARPEFVVPVWFDPWQYEHEEHLVVPLLKTIEHALRDLETKVARKPSAAADTAAGDMPGRSAVAPVTAPAAEAPAGTRLLGSLGLCSWDGRRELDAIADRLRNAGEVIGNVALALASGFKFKLAPLKDLIGIEVDLSPKDTLDAYRAAAERSSAAAAARDDEAARRTPRGRLAELATERESLYFDARGTLSSLTESDVMSLRFVVLVDDLDRCLPEKAVQMLESVKLFLNARGFSFVLAVDDEVGERGIAHRYRDYLPRGDAGVGPVSGTEYLEKIVHLPVHLPRWTPDEARRFLRDHPDYSLLFGAVAARHEHGDGDADALADAATARRDGRPRPLCDDGPADSDGATGRRMSTGATASAASGRRRAGRRAARSRDRRRAAGAARADPPRRGAAVPARAFRRAGPDGALGRAARRAHRRPAAALSAALPPPSSEARALLEALRRTTRRLRRPGLSRRTRRLTAGARSASRVARKTGFRRNPSRRPIRK